MGKAGPKVARDALVWEQCSAWMAPPKPIGPLQPLCPAPTLSTSPRPAPPPVVAPSQMGLPHPPFPKLGPYAAPSTSHSPPPLFWEPLSDPLQWGAGEGRGEGRQEEGCPCSGLLLIALRSDPLQQPKMTLLRCTADCLMHLPTDYYITVSHLQAFTHLFPGPAGPRPFFSAW